MADFRLGAVERAVERGRTSGRSSVPERPRVMLPGARSGYWSTPARSCRPSGRSRRLRSRDSPHLRDRRPARLGRQRRSRPQHHSSRAYRACASRTVRLPLRRARRTSVRHRLARRPRRRRLQQVLALSGD